ncbi:unnamed protein product [Cylindrotheca closterium]|uniref:G-protein coupled receptors family 1 profile domain-containing protein n=1 Tax=Cylindrotheca closterium TaxID=2856 RepID=A0AAD2G454_9STRA|nr:unnamed protein product [Cylindrotheca closterium]
MSEEVAYMPTILQQKLLSILFVPSCILSMIGSGFIIKNIREEGKRTPYRSIMLWTSICDIIASIGIFMQPFLPPANRPDTYVWAIGNDASCNFLGFITQFAFSAHMYAGLLSYYFLMTVRHGVKQHEFAKKLPYIHGFIITWSVATGIAGIFLKAYGPTGAATACWVAGDLCEGDGCPNTSLIGYSFGGFAFLSLFSIIVNNFLLYRFVRATVLQGQKRGMKAEEELRNYRRPEEEDDAKSTFTEFGVRSVAPGKKPTFFRAGSSMDDDSTVKPKNKPKSFLRSSDKQWKRVQEVGKQSLLYVGAYFFCSMWPIGIQVLDNRDYEYNKNAAYVFLPLLIGQSILLPLMGFFSCIIYFRPTFGRVKKKFPNESKMWCVKRTLFGGSIKPMNRNNTQNNTASSGNGSFLPPPTSTLRVNFAGQINMSTLGPGNSMADYSEVDEDKKFSVHLEEDESGDIDEDGKEETDAIAGDTEKTAQSVETFEAKNEEP